MPPRNAVPALAALCAMLFLVPAAPADLYTVGELKTTLTVGEVDGIAVPFQSGVPLIDFEPQGRPRIDLGGPWKKERFAASEEITFGRRDGAGIINLEIESEGREQPGYDDAAWDTHTLPGVESEMPGIETESPEGYHSGVWYRRTVDVPSEWQGRSNRIVFLGANYVTDLWVNGEWVGVHEGGYTPFAFDLSDQLVYGGENTIALRIHKPLVGSRNDTVPDWLLMDWWSYTGVIQDLYLESFPAAHIVRVNAVPRGYNGRIEVDVVVHNVAGTQQPATVAVEAFAADPQAPGYLGGASAADIAGEPVELLGNVDKDRMVPAGGVRAVKFTLKIPSPNRWTPAEPNLYVLRTRLLDGDEILDEHHTQFGIRTVDAGDGKLFVNGRVAFLPGMARHEEWPDTGRTATWDRIRDDLAIIRDDLHCLFLRAGHYPNHVYTQILADRLGLAVMSEIPVYWFFQWDWENQEIRRVHQQMFREMVFANYNRPSVILWGTQNESVFLFASDIQAYNRMLVDDQAANFPDGRKITQSPAAQNWKLMSISQKPIDVAGWTLYYGVFYGEDLYADTKQFFLDHKEMYPEYPVIGTEYGSWANSEEQYAEQTETFTGTWQAFSELGALNADGTVNENGTLAAVSWWCAFNWYTKNGLPEFAAPFLQSMGLIHMDRTTWKPAAHALAEAYEPYAEFGGLGPAPDDYDDDDDGWLEDDDEELPGDDDDNDDSEDDDVAGDDDDDDDDDGCGC